jgi:hypothetical protein
MSGFKIRRAAAVFPSMPKDEWIIDLGKSLPDPQQQELLTKQIGTIRLTGNPSTPLQIAFEADVDEKIKVGFQEWFVDAMKAILDK